MHYKDISLKFVHYVEKWNEWTEWSESLQLIFLSSFSAIQTISARFRRLYKVAQNVSIMNERHRQKRITLGRYILALPRSIWYNFRLLPFAQACHLPILISHRTAVRCCPGSITISKGCPLRIGLVKIGFSTYQGSDFRQQRTRMNVRGRLLLQGDCDFGAGSSVEVAEKGLLSIGPGSHIGPLSLVICHKGITLGAQTRTSWQCTLMDTDQHDLVDDQGNCRNADREIVLGDNVWMGCHVIIVKGTVLASHTTVGAGSVVHGRFDSECTVLAGNPAAIVRTGLRRQNHKK